MRNRQTSASRARQAPYGRMSLYEGGLKPATSINLHSTLPWNYACKCAVKSKDAMWRLWSAITATVSSVSARICVMLYRRRMRPGILWYRKLISGGKVGIFFAQRILSDCKMRKLKCLYHNSCNACNYQAILHANFLSRVLCYISYFIIKQSPNGFQCKIAWPSTWDVARLSESAKEPRLQVVLFYHFWKSRNIPHAGSRSLAGKTIWYSVNHVLTQKPDGLTILKVSFWKAKFLKTFVAI